MKHVQRTPPSAAPSGPSPTVGMESVDAEWRFLSSPGFLSALPGLVMPANLANCLARGSSDFLAAAAAAAAISVKIE